MLKIKYKNIVVQIGNTLYVSIPAKKAKRDKISKGDAVEIELNKLEVDKS